MAQALFFIGKGFVDRGRAVREGLCFITIVILVVTRLQVNISKQPAHAILDNMYLCFSAFCLLLFIMLYYFPFIYFSDTSYITLLHRKIKIHQHVQMNEAGWYYTDQPFQHN